MKSDESRTGAAVARHFARLSHIYGEGEAYGNRRAADLRALSAELKAAGAILDLGCGNGKFLAAFPGVTDARRFGADLSREMLLQARRTTDHKVPLLQADALRLPFKSQSFGFVMCSHVLIFVAAFDEAVAEIARVLRPGGMLAATGGESGMRNHMRRIIGAQWPAFEAAMFASRASVETGAQTDTTAVRHSDERHLAAYRNARLAAEVRRVTYTVHWAGIEEWTRVRWFPVASEHQRQVAERIFAGVDKTKVRAEEPFELAETLLIGRKQ